MRHHSKSAFIWKLFTMWTTEAVFLRRMRLYFMTHFVIDGIKYTITMITLEQLWSFSERFFCIHFAKRNPNESDITNFFFFSNQNLFIFIINAPAIKQSASPFWNKTKHECGTKQTLMSKTRFHFIFEEFVNKILQYFKEFHHDKSGKNIISEILFWNNFIFPPKTFVASCCLNSKNISFSPKIGDLKLYHLLSPYNGHESFNQSNHKVYKRRGCWWKIIVRKVSCL